MSKINYVAGFVGKFMLGGGNMKVKFSDKRLLKSFATVILGISTVLSLVLLFADVPDSIKTRSLLTILFCLQLFSSIEWLYKFAREGLNYALI